MKRKLHIQSRENEHKPWRLTIMTGQLQEGEIHLDDEEMLGFRDALNAWAKETGRAKGVDAIHLFCPGGTYNALPDAINKALDEANVGAEKVRGITSDEGRYVILYEQG